MAPGQVSDQCQIVLVANIANLGPYPFGRTLWKRGVQYATKDMRKSRWGPVWDRFRSTYNAAGQVSRAFSVRGTVLRRLSLWWYSEHVRQHAIHSVRDNVILMTPVHA